MLSSPVSSLLILQLLYIWSIWLKEENCTAQNLDTGLISSDFQCDGPDCFSLKATEKYGITVLFRNFTTFPIPEQEGQYYNSVRWQNFTMGREPAKQLKFIRAMKNLQDCWFLRNDAKKPANLNNMSLCNSELEVTWISYTVNFKQVNCFCWLTPFL